MTTTNSHYHIWILRGGSLHRSPHPYSHRQGAWQALKTQGLKGKVLRCVDASCLAVPTCPSCGQALPKAS